MYQSSHLATSYLLYLMISYGLFFQKSNNISLELYEHIILPISVLIITLLNRNSGFVAFKIVAILLLIVQSLLVVVKIIYFNSVTEQLAQYINIYAEYRPSPKWFDSSRSASSQCCQFSSPSSLPWLSSYLFASCFPSQSTSLSSRTSIASTNTLS